MLKKVKFVVVPNIELDSPPLDGTYGVVSYDGSPQPTRIGMSVDRVFKWSNTIYKFVGGLCDEIGGGSSPGDVLKTFAVDKLYLVDVPEHKRAELEEDLARHGFELEPA